MLKIEDEFAAAEFGDPRRTRRLTRLAGQLVEAPDVSFPKVLDEGQLEAAYRFFGSDWVSLEQIIAPHTAAAWGRARKAEVTLVVHDTTVISDRPGGCREDVPVTARGTQQFQVHATLALDGDGTRRPHGIVALTTHDQQDPTFHGRWAKHVDCVDEARGSVDVVHLMDREGDDYALLSKLAEKRARFVVRARHDRNLETERSLFDEVGSCEVAFVREAELGARKALHRGDSKQRRSHPDRAARRTKLAFAATAVKIPRPRSAPDQTLPELPLHVVRAWEIDVPAGEKPVEWVLLTTEPVDTPADIARIVEWYRARWVIEEYFKVLKTGCAYEQRQLESFHALRNALAVFAPIAWHLLLLRTEARDRPDQPATIVLSPEHIHVLRVAGRMRLPDAPTTRDVWLAVARLGGHLPRNGDPGWLTLARGYEKLDTLTAGWTLAKSSGTCDQ